MLWAGGTKNSEFEKGTAEITDEIWFSRVLMYFTPGETVIQNDTCISTFTEVLFIIPTSNSFKLKYSSGHSLVPLV